MMRALAGLWAALLLSGCFGEGCWNTGPLPADWTQPGLFGRMPTLGVYGNQTLVRLEPGDGFAVQNQTLDARVGSGNWSLVNVAWSGPNLGTQLQGAFPQSIELGPQGAVTGNILGRYNDSVEAIASQFLANVTTVDQAHRDSLTRSFKASGVVTATIRHDWHSDTDYVDDYLVEYHVNVTDVSVQGVWDREAGDAASRPSDGPEVWRFDLSYATLQAHSFELSGDKAEYTLRVEPTDHVVFQRMSNPPGTLEAFRARLNATFVDLGLGSPTAPDVAFRMQRACT